MSNTDKEPMMLVTTLMRMEGISSGSVMRQKRAKAPAPSIMTASYRSWEMFCSPAR